MIRSDHDVVDAARVGPKLWIGSHPPVPGHRCSTHTTEERARSVDLAKHGFDFLVLCAIEYQPAADAFPGVEVHHAPFDDDAAGLSEWQWQTAVEAAARTVDANRRGRRCLVTCFEGRNRSGLVTALALAGLSGCTPGQACDLIRERRGPAALSNPAFRGLLQRVQLQHQVPQQARCELCDAQPITRRYHEDAVCWIADCASCHVPMVVYREHGVAPARRHLEHMLELLTLCGRRDLRHEVTQDMHTIKDHYHAHLRPVGPRLKRKLASAR